MSDNFERRSGTERRHEEAAIAAGMNKRFGVDRRTLDFSEMSFFSTLDESDASIGRNRKTESGTTEEAIDFQDRIRN